MLTYRQLEHFVAVAQELHFSKAADRLGVAQSAVSVQIQQLEAHLGVRLLERHKRQPITLTDAGRLFYVEALSALRHMRRAQQVGQLAAQGLQGHVRMGYIASAVTSGMLSHILERFRLSHTQVRMQLLALDTPSQLQALEHGELDVGIVRPRRRYPSEVRTCLLHSEPLVIAMPQTHPLARKDKLYCHDLREQTFIAPQFNENEGFSELLARLASLAGFPIQAEYHVNDFITATSLAAAGYGIVITPLSQQRFSQLGVVFRPLSDFHEEVQLILAWRQRESSPAVRAFVEMAQGLAQNVK